MTCRPKSASQLPAAEQSPAAACRGDICLGPRSTNAINTRSQHFRCSTNRLGSCTATCFHACGCIYRLAVGFERISPSLVAFHAVSHSRIVASRGMDGGRARHLYTVSNTAFVTQQSLTVGASDRYLAARPCAARSQSRVTGTSQRQESTPVALTACSVLLSSALELVAGVAFRMAGTREELVEAFTTAVMRLRFVLLSRYRCGA